MLKKSKKPIFEHELALDGQIWLSKHGSLLRMLHKRWIIGKTPKKQSVKSKPKIVGKQFANILTRTNGQKETCLLKWTESIAALSIKCT